MTHSPRRNVFITGTDTGVGKTLAAASLVAALNARGARAAGMKPVASGSAATAHGLRNADAELLLAHSVRRADGATLDYAQVNPYAFADPIAPHLAARDAGVAIALDPIMAALAALTAQADCVVVEGVGGWMAPLGAELMQADLARTAQLPVILVVGLRLGCINHALLSARAIRADGCELLGWIGSTIDPTMQRYEDNIDTLRERIRAPCLGVLPHMDVSEPMRAVNALSRQIGMACAALSDAPEPPDCAHDMQSGVHFGAGQSRSRP